MPIDPRIPLGAQSQFPVDLPSEQRGRALTLANLGRQGTMQEQTIQENELKLDAMAQKLNGELAVQKILSETPDDPKTGMPDLRIALPRIITEVKSAGLGDALKTVKTLQDLSALSEAQITEVQQKLKSVRDALFSVEEIGDPAQRPEAYKAIIDNALAQGLIKQEQLGKDIPAYYPGPGPMQAMIALGGYTEKMIQRQKDKVVETRTAEKARVENLQTEAETRKIEAEMAGTLPTKPPPPRESKLLTPEEEAQQKRLRQSGTTGQGGKTLLNEGGLDVAADQYAYTGQMPTLGMGATADRAAVINRAAEKYPGLRVAASKADFDSNRASLVQLTKSMDAILAFERTTQKNMDLLIETSKSLPDTGSPWMNKPMRAVSEGLLGNTEIPAFRAAKMVDLTELSKIITNPNLTGVLTDEARKEVISLAPDSVTVKQLLAVAKILRRDMNNRKTSMQEQRDAVTKRITNMLQGYSSEKYEKKPDSKSDPLGIR